MYRLYPDLRDKLGEPLWHDEQGVPRYVPYHPSHGGIYDDWSALLEIACQGCGRRFQVSSNFSKMELFSRAIVLGETAEEMVKRVEAMIVLPTADNDGGMFHFGDAPWHQYDSMGCSGTTMTTDTTAVLECWLKERFEWVRHPRVRVHLPAAR